MSGGMAIVGLPWETIQTICPPDIYFSGDNSQNIIMISGPSESLKSFAKELTEKRIFVRLLDTCEIAPHSPYMADAGVLLREYAKEVIPNKTLRSSKWISTSVSEEDWDSPEAQYMNDIYVENLLNNQVRFYQASLHIPNNSVVIEVSPKATLGIFVEETVPSVRYLPCVLKKNEINPAIFSKENFKSLLRRENDSTF
ncbi:unnamed protein product [Allacma fusca]|uniref:Malonyl-CoA:ACP transacylase (MAT) domain-containing protein n=1 Tax=Allacma fusca TaxID=39272 RepID=A0A8J2KVS7_9HEXA|nr:unnamed protein product [Allacma fusca]